MEICTGCAAHVQKLRTEVGAKEHGLLQEFLSDSRPNRGNSTLVTVLGEGINCSLFCRFDSVRISGCRARRRPIEVFPDLLLAHSDLQALVEVTAMDYVE